MSTDLLSLPSEAEVILCDEVVLLYPMSKNMKSRSFNGTVDSLAIQKRGRSAFLFVEIEM